MKVLVQLNHRIPRTFLFRLERGTTVKQVRRILKNFDRVSAIQKLMRRSVSGIVIPEEQKRKAARVADFVISDGYTAERLG